MEISISRGTRCRSLTWATPTLRTRRHCMCLPLAWSYREIVSITTHTCTLRSATKRPDSSGLKHWMQSSLCVLAQSSPDMACLIPIARRVTSRKHDVTSETSTFPWELHRRHWNSTRGCSHYIPTALIRGRSGRLQGLQNQRLALTSE